MYTSVMSPPDPFAPTPVVPPSPSPASAGRSREAPAAPAGEGVPERLREAPAAQGPGERKGFGSLQHGLRSAAILLPDDDAEAFQHLRRDLFAVRLPPHHRRGH